jgi:tetratricopeptide (TPR) repeat protein
MAARLDDERRRLDELQVGDHAVRASFEISYTTLEPPAQRVFRALGYLGRTAIEPWLAAAALGIADADVIDPLEDLVTAQLLDVARSPAAEYRLHDLLRVFARERFDAQEPPGRATELVRRVAEAFLAVALRAEHALCHQGVHPCGRQDGGLPDEVAPDSSRLPREPDLIAWLSARRTAAQAAVAAVHEEGLWAHCWVLGRALIPALEVGGHYDDWLQVSRLAQDAAHRAGQPAWVAAIDAGLGTLHHYRGEWEQSRATLERALAIWENCGDAVGSAYAHLVLAMTIRAAGGSGTESLLHKALRTAAAVADPVLDVEALRCLAWVDRDHGRPDRAVRRLTQALRRMTDIRDSGHRLRGYVLHDLGVMQADRRQHDAATDTLRTALRIFQRARDSHWTGLTLFRLGETYHARGQLDEAVGQLHQARDVFVGLHDRLWEANVLVQLGDTHREMGQHELAEQFVTTSADLYRQMDQTLQHAHVQVVLGELREAQHDLAAAHAAFAEASQHLSGTRPSRWRERAKAGLARIPSTLPHELGV